MELQSWINLALISSLGSLIALIGFITKLSIKDKDRIERVLSEHITKCNEIPKSLLVEMIENLSEKLTLHTTQYTIETKMQRERYHSMNTA